MFKHTLVKVFAPLVLLASASVNAADYTITFDEVKSNSCWGDSCSGNSNLSRIINKQYQKGAFGAKKGYQYGDSIDVQFWAQKTEEGSGDFKKEVDFDGNIPFNKKNADAYLTLFNSDLNAGDISGSSNGNIDNDLLVDKGNIAIIHERNFECDVNNNNRCENPDDRYKDGNSTNPQNPTGTPNGGFVFVRFSEPVKLHSIDLADIEGSNNQRGSFRFYNGNNTVLNAANTWTPMDVTGNGGYTTQDFSLTNSITAIVIRMQGSGGFKNIAFSKVPEPSTLAILGLALFGLAWKRKKA